MLAYKISHSRMQICPFFPSAQVKLHVRKLLPSGLADEHSKVRNTVAYAVAAIAHWDWPENWPDLFDQLMLALNSSNPNIVHGSMRVLTGKAQQLLYMWRPLPKIGSYFASFSKGCRIIEVSNFLELLRCSETCRLHVHACHCDLVILTLNVNISTLFPPP